MMRRFSMGWLEFSRISYCNQTRMISLQVCTGRCMPGYCFKNNFSVVLPLLSITLYMEIFHVHDINSIVRYFMPSMAMT